MSVVPGNSPEAVTGAIPDLSSGRFYRPLGQITFKYAFADEVIPESAPVIAYHDGIRTGSLDSVPDTTVLARVEALDLELFAWVAELGERWRPSPATRPQAHYDELALRLREAAVVHAERQRLRVEIRNRGLLTKRTEQLISTLDLRVPTLVS